MTTIRRLGCIGTLVAALALAGCGESSRNDYVAQPQSGRVATAVLPADCKEVINVTGRPVDAYMTVTYKTAKGETATQQYCIQDGQERFVRVEWKAVNPEKSVEQVLKE